jgi:AraC-like DNA-binding protein
MDFSIAHWAPYPRRYPSAFPVVTVQFANHKEHWVHQAFGTCDFSLILRGRGEFLRFGKTWSVQAPCVITQWPGEYVEYGPLAGETWDELYFVYDASLMPKFQQCGLIDLERPVWPIADWATLNVHLAEMEQLARVAVPERVVDRVDRLCEQIILSTWLPPHNAAEGGPEMNALLAEVRRDLSRPVDLEQEAARQGMSISTFRRRWAAISDVPPARYLQQLRMREACRLLVETVRPIYEIADAVGFADEFYFSRRFRLETHLSPRDYRKTYQTRHPF